MSELERIVFRMLRRQSIARRAMVLQLVRTS